MGYDLVIDMDLEQMNELGHVPYELIIDTLGDELIEKYNTILSEHKLWGLETRLTMLKAQDPEAEITHALLVEFKGMDEALTIPIKKGQFKANLVD